MLIKMASSKNNNQLFKPGKYRAKLLKPARIETQVTVDNTHILDVKLKSLQGEQKIAPDLAAEFKGQILRAQSLNIDGITSASILTKAVKSVVGEALAKAREH